MPRKITLQEAKRMGLRPMGKRHPLHAEIENLEKGDVIHITRDEFRWKKTSPFVFINRIMKKTSKKFTILKTKNGLGWVVERVK